MKWLRPGEVQQQQSEDKGKEDEKEGYVKGKVVNRQDTCTHK